MQAASGELEAMPDGVLVEVDSDDAQVRVTKHGGDIVVRVKSGSDRVHVSAPLRLFSSVARSVEATCS